MKQKTSLDETYEFIGRLALALFSQEIKVSYSSLIKILVDNGRRKYWSPRAMARGISAAYRRWEKLENDSMGVKATCAAIAATYVNQNGVPSWHNY